MNRNEAAEARIRLASSDSAPPWPLEVRALAASSMQRPEETPMPAAPINLSDDEMNLLMNLAQPPIRRCGRNFWKRWPKSSRSPGKLAKLERARFIALGAWSSRDISIRL